jgi:hypothetical protein
MLEDPPTRFEIYPKANIFEENISKDVRGNLDN